MHPRGTIQDHAPPAPKPYFDERSMEILGNSFEFFGMLDNEGRVLVLRGRIFERVGTDAGLLTGQRFSETVFWQSSEATGRLVDSAVSDALAGSTTQLLVDFRISADEKEPIELQIQPLTSTGELFVSGRSLAGAVPVTANENEQLLRAAENAGIGLWFWDIRDDRIYSTPSCNEVLGLVPYEPVTFESFLRVVHPDDRSEVEALFASLQTQTMRYEKEFRVVRHDGTVEWISAQGRSIGESGSSSRMMGVVRNITEQTIAAEELAKVYDREKRARDEAEEANRAKDFFLAFVSHELRSPLNAILGWSKILLTKQIDDDTRRNALETIERSARLQTKLINDLVDSARVASGKLRLEFHPTNFCEIVRATYQAQKPSAEAHSLNFTFDTNCDEVIVFGDAGRLQQVLTNLISNAIKFTPDGGSIAVTVRKGEETVSVHVRDTGQGISSEALPNIFRQFSQADIGRPRNNSGLGLGLSIVKILVAKHGGNVHALSEGVGKGAEFVVTLPLSASQDGKTRPTAAPVEKGRPISGRRI